jgi:hypothetical protein
MIADFQTTIGAALLVKEQIARLDKKKIWPYFLPEVAATDEQIIKAERHLGHSLNDRYKAFLKCANGWKCFYQTVDLFGTEDLVSGPRNDTGEFMLGLLDDDVLRKSGVEREDLLPLAATRFDKDLFVLVRPSSSCAGTVLWFAGEEIDRFLSFDDYFNAMIEYNRQELTDLEREHAER